VHEFQTKKLSWNIQAVLSLNVLACRFKTLTTETNVGIRASPPWWREGICTGSLFLLEKRAGFRVDPKGAWTRGPGRVVVSVVASNGSALSASICPYGDTSTGAWMGAYAATTVTSQGPLMALSGVSLSPTLTFGYQLVGGCHPPLRFSASCDWCISNIILTFSVAVGYSSAHILWQKLCWYPTKQKNYTRNSRGARGWVVSTHPFVCWQYCIYFDIQESVTIAVR